MSNLHAVVIYHVGQMVCGMAVRFDENGVIIYTVDEVQFLIAFVLANFPIDQISELVVFIQLQANDMCLPLRCSIF